MQINKILILITLLLSSHYAKNNVAETSWTAKMNVPLQTVDPTTKCEYNVALQQAYCVNSQVPLSAKISATQPENTYLLGTYTHDNRTENIYAYFPEIDPKKRIYKLVPPGQARGILTADIIKVSDPKQTGSCPVYDANQRKAFCAQGVKTNLLDTPADQNNVKNPPQGYYLLGYYQIDVTPNMYVTRVWENHFVWAPK